MNMQGTSDYAKRNPDCSHCRSNKIYSNSQSTKLNTSEVGSFIKTRNLIPVNIRVDTGTARLGELFPAGNSQGRF